MSLSLEELDPNFAVTMPGDDLAWYDARALGVEGQGWTDVESPFDRLPARAKPIVRKMVWELSRCSAGLCVRFVTSAERIGVRWTLIAKPPPMKHMPPTGHSGLDLYVRHQGRWQWRSIAQPDIEKPELEQSGLLDGSPGGEMSREFTLYMPLYNSVSDVRIGIPRDARLVKAPSRTHAAKPVVFYGTSIVQGGCAARPGMAYPALIGRWLDVETINLGFSGHGPMDLEIAPLLAELDASLYVIDSVPNMTPELVAQRAVPFVQTLRASRKTTPILLMECIIYRGWIDADAGAHVQKNQELRRAYQTLSEAGVDKLHYLTADNLLGDDWEGTVDGTHPTDVGFLRMAEAITPVVRTLIG